MKMNTIKRIFTFGLALIVLLNSIIVFLANYIETEIHREKEYSIGNLKDSNVLSLSVSEFISIAWIGERDFVYNGIVYDCDTISCINGKINLLCHADNEETILKNSMSANFDNGAKNIPSSKSSKEFYKLFQAFENNFSDEISSRGFICFNYSNYNKQLPASVVLSHNFPPPEINV